MSAALGAPTAGSMAGVPSDPEGRTELERSAWVMAWVERRATRTGSSFPSTLDAARAFICARRACTSGSGIAASTRAASSARIAARSFA